MTDAEALGHMLLGVLLILVGLAAFLSGNELGALIAAGGIGSISATYDN